MSKFLSFESWWTHHQEAIQERIEVCDGKGVANYFLSAWNAGSVASSETAAQSPGELPTLGLFRTEGGIRSVIAPAEEWALVSLMGHVQFSGRITEEERFGGKMGRCDIPQPDGSFVSRYFTAASIYSVIPCTEECARIAAGATKKSPVGVLPAPPDQPSEDGEEGFEF